MLANSLDRSAISQNFSQHIVQNAYPGRGIVLGCSTAHQWIQIYWIMGRSENSRNRVFVEKDSMLQTKAADLSKVEDPSLIIYNAMRESNRCFIVTNGTQTDVIYQGFEQGRTFEEALATQSHEPDAPNFTPRISGCIDLRQSREKLKISLIKVSAFDTKCSEHYFFNYQAIDPGYGYAITTYRQDGNPLPSFEGVPFLVQLEGEAHQIAKIYWEALDKSNKISLAVKTIDPETKASETVIINKYHSSED